VNSVAEKKFALAITQFRDETGRTSFNIASKNQGIPSSDIILFVECWLEKFKDSVKGEIKDGIDFGKDPDEKYK